MAKHGEYFYVTAYSEEAPGDWTAAVWKYKTDGTLDTSFATSGYLVLKHLAGGISRDIFRGSLEMSDSSILLFGAFSNSAENYSAGILKIDQNGNLLTEDFGVSGAIFKDSSLDNYFITAILSHSNQF